MSLYKASSDDDLIRLISSADAVERTAAAVMMGQRRKEIFLSVMCDALKKEKKLYPKIALSESLALYGVSALPHLLPLLGTIGNNQHRIPDNVDLDKKSFPLPRDIAARIIIRIGSAALPHLEDILVNGSREQILEAVDAVGHIAYTARDCRSEKILIRLYLDNADDPLLVWKTVRAFQSFASAEVIALLEGVTVGDDPVLKAESIRSLDRIKVILNAFYCVPANVKEDVLPSRVPGFLSRAAPSK